MNNLILLHYTYLCTHPYIDVINMRLLTIIEHNKICSITFHKKNTRSTKEKCCIYFTCVCHKIY